MYLTRLIRGGSQITRLTGKEPCPMVFKESPSIVPYCKVFGGLSGRDVVTMSKIC